MNAPVAPAYNQKNKLDRPVPSKPQVADHAPGLICLVIANEYRSIFPVSSLMAK
jgi:hypothetical protein